jgi:hypothetical protein
MLRLIIESFWVELSQLRVSSFSRAWTCLFLLRLPCSEFRISPTSSWDGPRSHQELQWEQLQKAIWLGLLELYFMQTLTGWYRAQTEGLKRSAQSLWYVWAAGHPGWLCPPVHQKTGQTLAKLLVPRAHFQTCDVGLDARISWFLAELWRHLDACKTTGRRDCRRGELFTSRCCRDVMTGCSDISTMQPVILSSET